MQKTMHRRQRTIARSAEVQGIGYLTGKLVRLRFRPATAFTGVNFVRTDLGPQAIIHAHVDNVIGTERRTTIGDGPLSVGLVEHVLAALSALRIDNCYVEVDAPEPPGLDGSAQGFAEALLAAGTVTLPETCAIATVSSPLIVRRNDATLALYPHSRPELRASYLLDYGPGSSIDKQTFTASITPEAFLAEIAPCRTFLLEHEVQMLREQGIGSGSRITDLIVFGPKGPIDNRLRFANEPARHKVLDIIGDLSLLGVPVFGHLVAYRSGHPLNVELVRMLSKQLNGMLPRCKLAA